MFVVKYAKLWFGLGILFMIGSIISISVFGLRLGPDFTGGEVLEIAFPENVLREDISEALVDQEVQPNIISRTGDSTFRLEFPPFEEDEEVSVEDRILDALVESLDDADETVTVVSRSTISPIVGAELRDRSLWAIAMVILVIVLFITYVFRKNSKPVPSFYYGLAAIVALIHDVLIPVGIFAVLSALDILTIDLLFVVALLSILGTSVNDTIVVFDRVQENLRKGKANDFEDVVGKSISQTLMRSINTSLTLFVVLGSIVLFGGPTIQLFALALAIGVVFGTYSSLFIAAPFLIFMYRWRIKVRN